MTTDTRGQHARGPANKRTDADYEIEALSKSLAILEVLIEEEPIKEPRIVAKTRFSRDLVLRTLRTYRLRGYAAKNDRGEWVLGRNFLRLALNSTERNLNR